MLKYFIREIHETDYKQVTEMKRVGFNSCVIVDSDTQMVQGVLDYKPDKEVYLSLLMLSADLQGQGIGRNIYSSFELNMMQAGSISIRIDVVNDYPDNLIPFWEDLGFSENESVTLDWGNKKSNAVVMRKSMSDKNN